MRENIQNLTNDFRAVVEVIDKRRAKDDKRRSKVLSGVRRFRYNIWHEGDDKEKVEQLRKEIEMHIRSFHLGSKICGLNALERMKNEIETFAARQTQERETSAARLVEEMRAIATPQLEGIQQVQYYQQLDLIKRALKPVEGARFHEDGMPNGCLPHTREKLLEQLRSWAKDDSEACPSCLL